MFRLKDVKMKPKLIGVLLIVGLLPLIAVGVFSGILSNNSLMDISYDQLASIRGIKKDQIERFFNERRGDMGVLQETVATLRFETIKKLESVRAIKKTQIESFFNERMGDAKVLADNPYIKQVSKNEKLPENYYRIALYSKDNASDYHYYRQDANGLWSHKNGWRKATNKDNKGRIIRDPDTADRGKYINHCGFFMVPISEDLKDMSNITVKYKDWIKMIIE